MNRRSFIQHTVTAAGLAAVNFPSPQAYGQAGTKRPLQKAIMYATVGVPGSTLEKFRAIKEAGFAGVEPMSNMDEEEVVKACAETGLKVASVCCSTHWAKPLSHGSAATREVTLEDLKAALRKGKRWGARSVLLVPAVVDAGTSYADAYTRSQAEIRKAIPLAEELGVKIAIENVWNNFLLSPLEAARYVDEFNSPAVGWHFDIGNVINTGWPEQWIRILGKRITNVHIKEFSRKKAESSGKGQGFNVAFLEGDNNWPVVMKALDEIGYQGFGIAEQGGGDSLVGLKDLSTRMDKIFNL